MTWFNHADKNKHVGYLWQIINVSKLNMRPAASSWWVCATCHIQAHHYLPSSICICMIESPKLQKMRSRLHSTCYAPRLSTYQLGNRYTIQTEPPHWSRHKNIWIQSSTLSHIEQHRGTIKHTQSATLNNIGAQPSTLSNKCCFDIFTQSCLSHIH